MDIGEGVADLHMHTTASDGTCSVTDRIEQAQDRGLDAIAVTDHDTISGDLDGRTSVHGDLELVTGVEVRADVQETKVELLGYYVDPADHGLEDVLEEVRSYRRQRNRRLVDRLQDVADFDRSYEEIRATADGILGRPHIAGILVEDGIVGSVGEAFAEYLGADGAAFVSMERVPAATVVEAIQAAGGVVSLAHPGRVRADDIEPIVEELAAAGLDAIEVPYPYGGISDNDYADVDCSDAAALADQFDLLHTGGSDCHGSDSSKFRIGQVRLDAERFDALREQAETRRPLN